MTTGRRSGEPRQALAVETLTPLGTLKAPAPSTAGAGAPKLRNQTRLTAEQIEACMMVDSIGEIGQAVRSRGALISGCQFYIGLPADADNEDGRPARDDKGVALVDERMLVDAEDFLAQIVDGSGSQRGLLAAQSENYDGPGVAIMCAWYERIDGTKTTEEDPTRDHLRFEVVGADAYREERISSGTNKYVRLKRGGKEERLPPDAASWRMFRRHSRYPGETASWVLNILPIARNLLAYQLAGRSQALSLAVGDVHLVPSDAAPKKPLQDGQDVNTATDRMTPEEYGALVEQQLGDVISEIIEDTQSGRTVVGGVWAVEEKFLKSFGGKIEVGRKIDEGLSKLEAAALQRLKESADIEPEMLTGVGDANRWNGAQIDDMGYRKYYRPHVLGMASDWTSALVWPHLIGLGYTTLEVRQLCVLVNTRGVVADPDRSADAMNALKLGAIGWPGYRVMTKIPEDFAPTPEERAEIQEFLGGSRGTPGAGDGGSAPPTGVNPVNNAAGSTRHRLIASTGSDLGATLRSIEAGTRGALASAGAVAMDAALTRAGNKLSSLARKHLGRTVPLGLGALAHLTPDERRAAAAQEYAADDRRRREEMFTAAIALLQRHFQDISNDGLGQLLEALGMEWPGAHASRSPFTAASISVADLEAAVESGWTIADMSLTDWADATVFGDDPLEVAPTVPNTIWRRSMGALGGGVVAAGFGPVREALATMVAGPRFALLEPPRTGDRWYYGSAGTRQDPYAPHMGLDGEPITGPDDEVLQGAPWGTYWPGDHGGCQCDVVPVFNVETE